MASISTGYSFGATELVTSTKLNSAVNDATISLVTAVPIGTTTPAAGCFTSATATGGRFAALSASALNLSYAYSTATASALHVGFACDKYFTLFVNGTTLYIPCATATA